MALSQTQKYNVLRYLGWPIRTIDPTSLSYSKIISDRLDQFPSDAEDILAGILTRLSNLDSQLAKQVVKANIKAIDDIQFFENGTFELRKERVKIIKELASLVDIAMGPSCQGIDVYY